MKVAILGAGHGGCAMAAEMSLQGHEVSLYDKYPTVLAGLIERMEIQLQSGGELNFARLAQVSANLAEVVAGAQLLMVVTPAFAHETLAAELAPLLTDGQVLVLNPGRTGGALRVRQVLAECGATAQVKIAETQTLLYAARRTGPAEATIYGYKVRVTVAAWPTADTEAVVELLHDFNHAFSAAANVLETSLLNIGAIFHPGPTLLNMAWIESGHHFTYYHQGISAATAQVLERVDAERVAIATALNVPTLTAVEWLKEVYQLPESLSGLQETIRANSVYRDIAAPQTLAVRYISEDVPTGLVPLAALGEVVGVATPFINMLIDLANCVHRLDYRQQGYSLAKLGLDGDKNQVLAQIFALKAVD